MCMRAQLRALHAHIPVGGLCRCSDLCDFSPVVAGTRYTYVCDSKRSSLRHRFRIGALLLALGMERDARADNVVDSVGGNRFIAAAAAAPVADSAKVAEPVPADSANAAAPADTTAAPAN